jgi:spore coat polysaccharide biosynthesis protein SpsF
MVIREVIFRGDGGAAVGLGHLARLAALAAEARRRGARTCRFVLNDDDAARAFIAARGFDDVTTAPAAFDDELAFLAEAAREAPVVIDVRGKDPAFYRRLREAGAVVCAVDDMGEPIAAQLVVNGDAAPDYAHYKEVWPPQRFLLGTRYVPLPPAYTDEPPPPDDFSRTSLLLTFGGADADDFSRRALAALDAEESLPPADVDLAVGPAYRFIEAAREDAARSRHRVAVHAPATDMLALYRRARLAMGAGGVSQYEILSQRLPVVSIPHVERERAECRAFAAAGAALTFEAADLAPGGAAARAAATLWRDENARTKMADAGRRLVDGRGASRILDALEELWAAR